MTRTSNLTHFFRTWHVRHALFCTALTCLLSATAHAAPVATFTTPDAPLPAFDGTGLNGTVWSSALIAPVDTLAAARTFIGANAASSTFSATVVDYPNGAPNDIFTSDTFADGLGVDAASLSDPGLASVAVLNSILQIDGFLRVDMAGSLFLGLGSDDGSELIIQGTQVIDNDGIHAFPGGGAGPVEIEFTTPGLYAMEILFFESQQIDWGLEFSEGSPGGGTPVPTKKLYPVPESASLLLLSFGLMMTCVASARRRK